MPRMTRKHPILAIGTLLGLSICGVAGSQLFDGLAGWAQAQTQQQQEEEERRRGRRNQQQDGGGGGGQQQQQQRQERQDGGGQDGGQERSRRQQSDDGGQQERSRRQQQQTDDGGQERLRRQQQQQGQDGGQERTRRQQQGEDGGQERSRRQQQGEDGGQERSRRQQQGEDGGQERQRRQQQQENERAKQEEQRNQQLRQNADQERQDREKRRRDAEQDRAKKEEQRNQQLRQNADQERQDREKRRREAEEDRAKQEQQGNQKQRQNADQDRRRQDGQGQGQDGRQIGGQTDGDRDRRRIGRGDRPEDRKRLEEDRQRFQRFEKRELSGEERRERRRERQEFTKENLQDVARGRRRREEGGRVVFEEADKRVIIRDGNRTIIRHDETDRIKGASRDVKVERGEGGRERTVITRDNGIQIITIQDRDGKLIKRIKRFPDGHEIVLINNDFEGGRRRRDRDRDRDRDGDRDRGGDRDRYRGPVEVFIDLPDIDVDYGSRDYYASYEESGEDEIYEVLTAPPVEEFAEDYTLDEIRYSRDIRQRLRKVNVNTVNFASGSWALSEDQTQRLSLLAKVINRVLTEDPEEVFLITGHTDAVGSDEDNLSLSDRRAETVARILTDEFGVPAENLVTQGYGETDLLVQTSSDEIRNRRVEVMRITPALAREEGGGTARRQ